MPAPHPHLTAFEGGPALSDFRAAALIARLREIEPSIASISARHVYWVATDMAPDEALQQRLGQLLDNDGAAPQRHPLPEEVQVVVMPRVGTVSPWSSKATDIARNCALPVRRVERVTEYRLPRASGLLKGFLGGPAPLAEDVVDRLAALLHDRMTESVARAREAARALFDEHPGVPMAHVDMLGQGRQALVQAMVQDLHHGAPVDANQAILAPGEPEQLSEVLRRREGIPVEPGALADMRAWSERLGVAAPA